MAPLSLLLLAAPSLLLFPQQGGTPHPYGSQAYLRLRSPGAAGRGGKLSPKCALCPRPRGCVASGALPFCETPADVAIGITWIVVTIQAKQPGGRGVTTIAANVGTISHIQKSLP